MKWTLLSSWYYTWVLNLLGGTSVPDMCYEFLAIPHRRCRLPISDFATLFSTPVVIPEWLKISFNNLCRSSSDLDILTPPNVVVFPCLSRLRAIGSYQHYLRNKPSSWVWGIAKERNEEIPLHLPDNPLLTIPLGPRREKHPQNNNQSTYSRADASYRCSELTVLPKQLTRGSEEWLSNQSTHNSLPPSVWIGIGSRVCMVLSLNPIPPSSFSSISNNIKKADETSYLDQS